MDAATPGCWIPLCADTLVVAAEAACRGDELSWPAWLRRDPGLVWHFCLDHSDISLDRFPAALRQGLDSRRFVQSYLETSPVRFADWSKPPAAAVYHHAQLLAALAERLASLSRLDDLTAACIAQLALLGPMAASQDAGGRKPDRQPNALTRHLIRRANAPAWVRELLLVHDLPGEVSLETKGLQRWVWLLQCAVGLINKAAEARGQEAARQLHLSWSQEKEFAAAMAARLTDPPTRLSGEPAALLVRLIRLAIQQPAQTLSFTVKQLEGEVEALRTRLTASQQTDQGLLREHKLTAIAELAAGAGHEINNPLAVISGQAQYLLKHEEDMNRAKALERIILQTNRIHLLLRDLMFFARPPEPRFKPILVKKLLGDAVKEMAELALARDIKLEMGAVGAKDSITCDADLVRTALRCLLQNGIEAAPAGGWVRVEAQARNGRIDFQIEDNGPGVPAVQQDNVFDPFFSGRAAGRGVGLGLSKVWRIAQLHHGDVRLQVRPGQPTRFLLEIPQRPGRGQQNKVLRLKRSA